MSDRTLDKLIETLKSEAIEAADKASKKLLKEAEAQAQKIIKKAEEEREQIRSQAQEEAQATISKGESALRQAARDLNITVQNDLIKLFEAVLKQETHQVFTPDLIKSAAEKIIENIGAGTALKLPEDFEQKLSDHVHMRLQISNDLVSLTEENSVLNGLSISKTDEGWSYHITPEEVSKLLNEHLSKKWIDILKKGQ